jgi:UDP-glucuronate 4-epimerase
MRWKYVKNGLKFSIIPIIFIFIIILCQQKQTTNKTNRHDCVNERLDLHEIEKRRNILVTGAAGFIGMHTCLKLKQNGYAVVAFDSVNAYYSLKLKKRRIDILNQNGIMFIQGDVCNSTMLQHTIIFHKIDQVVHLAAQAGVRYSLDHPQEYVQNNIQCFVTLLETLVRTNISENGFVYASSSSVYGLNQKIPFSETDRIGSPNSLYAATKFTDEIIAKTYYNLYGLKSVGLRFFTVYGPWGRPDMAYYIFARKIKNNETITIFDYGRTMRDYTYIDDIVSGVVSAVKTRFNTAEILNLGNNKPVTISTFVQTLEFHMGQKAIIEYANSAKGDVPQTFADISKARCLIAYNPVTDINIGIKKFVTWFNEYETINEESSNFK